MKHIITWVLIGCLVQITSAQKTTFPYNGVQDERNKTVAFTNATIFVDANTKIDQATLLIKEGKVVSCGAGVATPNDATVVDLSGKYIYPSFVEVFSSYGVKAPEKKKREGPPKPQFVSNKKGAYGWNEAIKPEVSAAESFTADAKEAKTWRSIGFGSVVSHIPDGIIRGTGTLVSLSDGPKDNEVVLKEEVAAYHSFKKGVSTQNYPSSLMGSIALLKQSHYDAEWYAQNKGEVELNLSLQKLTEQQALPKVIVAEDQLTALRADKLGDELNFQYIIKGAGDEYKRLDDIKATGATYVIPVNFPKAKDVEDPFDADVVSLADMKHWEMAPANANFLNQQSIPFCFTSSGLKEKKGFLKQIQTAIKYGLPQDVALKALTETPAKILKIDDQVGSLKAGMLANFIITSDSIFKKDSKILENWVQGNPYIIEQPNEKELKGMYKLSVGDMDYDLKISGEKAKPKFEIMVDDTTEIKVNASLKKNAVSLSFTPDTAKAKQKNNLLRLSGWFDEKLMKGKGQLADGSWVDWSAVRTGDIPKKEKEENDKEKSENKKDEKLSDIENGKIDEEAKKDEKEKKHPTLDDVIYPFVAYGWKKEDQPKAKTVLIKNATVWTNEDDGILKEADVLIKDGKIAKVGKGLKAKADIEIDATGKHVTPGIIDEHSHIAISRGVNESAQHSTAEVSIADVINSEDVNIYRQLAGGVTAAQLLHGSANPIGGQSGIIKLRWGSSPEEMKIKNADGFIKFALGENVKQSNWGDHNRVRFPQSRMGVEQVFIDHFTRAKEYESAGLNKRKDLELEALLEIINKKRFITCHSYVQSEITMLMRVAEQFDFTVNTFTHILEGYKIADKMKAHGVAASTFSDWWRYKFEVMDAIPHNAAILNEMDVVTAINSDDAEMARRLNQEAAKAVKYGGVSEEDALKMVTLNPAKMLHLDDRMGSLKSGKDGDVVVWSHNPLSVKAKAEQTFVDGILYFDLEEDLKKREAIAKERNRLIQKMIEHKKGGGATESAKPKKQHLWHCDDVEEYRNHDHNEEDH